MSEKKSWPLVSISIITYNQIDFIHETLESALSQDYENLEIVVSDDASTDGTDKVILEYAERYPGRLVALVGGPRLGITGNDNRALNACRGKYIAFQGGDDVLLPGKIKAQVEWFEADKNRVLCGHQVEVFYEDGSPSHLLSSRLPKGNGPKWLIENGVPFGATAIMIRREALPPAGFDERLPYVSDTKLWIDVLSNDGEFGFVDGVLARYRKHSGNITSNVSLCSSDMAKMFDIIHRDYPLMSVSCRKGRALLLYYAGGIREMHLRNNRNALKMFFESLRLWPFSWKTYIRIFSIFFKTLARQ